MSDQGTLNDRSGAEDGRPRAAEIIGVWGPTIGTLIGTLVAFLGLVFLLFPRLKPEEPPAELGVKVSNVAVEEWLSDGGSPPTGVVVSYVVSFNGYKGQAIQMEWAVFDAANRSRVDPGPIAAPAGIDPATGNVVTNAIEAQAKTDQARERITAHPLATSCLFVRIYAYDDSPGHTRLDYGDSPPFQWRDPHADCSQFAATPAAPDSSA